MHAVRLTLKLGAMGLVGLAAHTKLGPLINRKVLAITDPHFFESDRSYLRWNTNWDRRDPRNYLTIPESPKPEELANYKESLKELTPTAARHILLIRHGQYFEKAVVDEERILTNLGRSQADKTGQRLKQLGLTYSSLTSSTLSRAQETAGLIHQHIPEVEVVADQCLCEGAPATPDPSTGRWNPTQDQFFQDGARIEHAFRKYFYRADAEQTQDSYEIIVCHSNVIRYFICRALQFPIHGWIRVSVANCSMTLMTVYPDGTVVMEMMGDHGHIPPESVSYH